ALVAWLRRQPAGSSVGLATDDGALRLRATGSGFRVWGVPAAWMSQFESRETQEKLRLLRTDVDRLLEFVESSGLGKEAELSLSFVDGKQEHSFAWDILEIPTRDAVSEEALANVAGGGFRTLVAR